MRQDGVLIVGSIESDKIVEASTIMCRHCGGHWVPRPGSGTKRGFCMRCNGPVCGPRCAGACRPTEQLLENIEAGRPEDYVPTRVAVPKLWLPG